MTIAFSSCTADALQLQLSALRNAAEVITHQLDGLLRHVIDDDEINLANVETLLPDRRRHEYIELSVLEVLDRLTISEFAYLHPTCF